MAGLSKSRLMSFLQCPKRLWLEKHRPELAEVSAAQQAVFDMGHAVGDVARRLYDPRGTGRLISGEGGMAVALKDTTAALAEAGVTPLFEATFERDGLLIRADVLERKPARLVEVKSSTSVKDEHVTDCAIQAWVLAAGPAAPRSVALAHVNNQFIYAGDGDYQGLLAEEDLTPRLGPLMEAVPRWLAAAQETVAQDEPAVAIGSRCRKPYSCPFMQYCWPKTDYPLTRLPGVGPRLDDLVARGFRDIRDLPENLVPPGDGLRVWRAARSGQADNDGSAGATLAAQPYPRYYLDFETIGGALPLWPGTRPYQAVPFQWSLHREQSPGRLEHVEFLDLSGGLPARAVAEALLGAIGTQGPVFTYTSYEKQCLATLGACCPDLAPGLAAVIGRLLDLHPIAKGAYYHPAMQGSWSIKALLPAMAPEMDYGLLEGVRDGGGAQQAFLEAIAPGTSVDRRLEIRRQLLRYCGHDTLALVRVVQFLATG
jgi:hypothetical protein